MRDIKVGEEYMSKELTVPANTVEAYSSNLSSKLQFADMLLKTQMCPSHLKTPQQVIAAMLYGQEIGFSPLQALQSVNVIQGRPTLDAAGIKAKILEAGGTFKTKKWTDTECTLECTRGDWTDVFTFTMDDAERMGLSGKENWRRMPKQMLYARCISTLGRNMYADVLRGFYGTEEMQDSISATAKEPQIAKNQEPIKEPTIDIEPQEPAETLMYYIPEITREQRIYMEKRGAKQNEAGFWISSVSLGAKLEKFRVKSEEHAQRIVDAIERAKEFNEMLGERGDIESVEVAA